jgi:hypothetical protein
VGFLTLYREISNISLFISFLPAFPFFPFSPKFPLWLPFSHLPLIPLSASGGIGIEGAGLRIKAKTLLCAAENIWKMDDEVRVQRRVDKFEETQEG